MRFRIQHCFQGQSGASEDRYCNIFHYQSSRQPSEVETGTTLVGDNIATFIRNFYTGGSPHGIQDYLSPYLWAPGRTIKIYDITTGPSGPPVYEVTDLAEPFTTADPPATPLPSEVAVCLSYSALQVAGPRARRRGRIYLGPLNIDALNYADPYQVQRVHIEMMDAVLNAANSLATSMRDYDSHWNVYSATDGQAYPITRFEVDNAFDTQRRRGEDAGARSGADFDPTA